MERAARRLMVFSFACLVLVIAFGTLRSMGPVRTALDSADLAKYTALFHSHFDQLCWLGAAAAGATLWVLRDTYAGPAWAPTVFAWIYPAGSALFSVSFLVKAIGLRSNNEALTRTAFAALVSLGGLLLLAAMAVAAVLVAALLRPRSAPRSSA